VTEMLINRPPICMEGDDLNAIGASGLSLVSDVGSPWRGYDVVVTGNGRFAAGRVADRCLRRVDFTLG
jgi:hypothetical protein